MQDPRLEPRFAARPAAVEAAYQRYGAVREARRPEPYPVARAEMRRRDEPRFTRVAERDVAPHLPLRDLLPPRRDRAEYRGRDGRGYEDQLPPSRRAGRTMVPPQRPLVLADSRMIPRHVAYARTREE